MNTRRLFVFGVALLLLLALVPMASARPNSGPALQATATPAATEAATEAATAAATGTAVAGTGTPGTLPETGGEIDNTPWASILMLAIAALILFTGLGLALSRRPSSADIDNE
ncbi:MAG TPA: hypothetical protein VJG32_13690 [Anaerolineae bacterium]|nr:hypothetical protein [Anaerolineae bacterium]